jgi:glutamate synthase (NADPH/NADH) large chain
MISSSIKSNRNTIIGNTVLYGATAGKLFAAGQAGERFAVRNSGASVVVEGCGSNGCEYMTGGVAVILGDVGANFGAGMTGGMAFVYDESGLFEERLNRDMVTPLRIQTDYWEDVCKGLIQEHVAETASMFAENLLNDWEREKGKFWQIAPTELLDKLEHPVFAETADEKTA